MATTLSCNAINTNKFSRKAAVAFLPIFAAFLGCGLGVNTSTTPAASAPPPVRIGIQSVTNFGDSITCGYWAFPNDGAGNVYSVEGYAGVFDAKVGKPSQNFCRPGDEAADMARAWVYPYSQPQLGAGQLYTAVVGTNDANSCGSSPGCLLNWRYSLEASLAWLAIPSVDKVLGEDMTTVSGTWTKYLDFGLGTADPNATISFPANQTVAGRSLNLAYRVGDCSTCDFSAAISVDGAPVDVVHTEVHTGHTVGTPNGDSDTIFLDRVPLGAAGKHTVSVTTSSAGGYVCIMWAGVPSANYATVDGSPHVILGLIPPSQNAALTSTIALYNTLLPTIVKDLSSDGMYIETVDTGATLNLATDMSDFVHPNNAGHAKIAAAFAGALK